METKKGYRKSWVVAEQGCRKYIGVQAMSKKYSDGKDYKVIALLHACFFTEDQRDLITMITNKSKEYNCKVIFFSTLTNFYLEQLDYGELRIFDTISVEKFDAIVLMAETFKTEEGQKEFVQRAIAAQVPVIAVDHWIDGCINISFDYKDSFREIVKHMVEYHGYQKINFMAGQPHNAFSEERQHVLEEVLKENNIGFDASRQVYYGYFWERPTVEAMKQMLADNPVPPEAIVCANDTMALTVCDFLRKQGFRVPEDVAVSGFDGLEAGRYHQPQLLTSLYDINVFADALFQLIQGGDCVVGERSLTVSAYSQLQIGGSCGCKGIDAQDASARIIQLKSAMNEQMEYQINLSRMVANYGDGDGMEIVQKVIPEQLKQIQYYDLWLCSEEYMLIDDYVKCSASGRKEKHGNYHAIHYKNDETQVQTEIIEDTSLEELIPDLETQLENNHTLLVVSLPNQQDPNAYAVISLNLEKFWYTAYSSFIFHMRFLLDMQRTKKMMMQLYRMDALTGVLNRNGFYDKMKKIMGRSDLKELTVISLDMCEFKKINDTYGHAEGDVALQAVGTIIQESVTHHEIAARTGGDEFLIILFRENQEVRTEEIIQSLTQKADYFNENNEKAYSLQFSIGVCSEKVGKHSLDYFLRKADQKMYAHKKEQKMGR